MADPAPGAPIDPTARLVGPSLAMQALRAQIRHLAAFDAVGNPHVPTLLLQGETGTGKGLVARVMHDSGPRATGPFVEVNCAAIPDTLLEAELFGYEAGAFSEAKRAKPGLFATASGGTLFLDEIDSLPLALQGKLLTALEAKQVRRLGAVREQAVDVKLIAAAQVDLSGAVHTGRFRVDLYHRLAVIVLTLPPLRARAEDILVLAQAYVQRYATAHRVRPKQLSSGAEAWLNGHSWPGNVRELSHLLERVTLLSAEPIVDADTLVRLSLPPGEPTAPTGATPPREADQPPDEAARIRQALQDVGGNVVRAARQLGLSRGGLRYRMLRYGIEPATRGVGPSWRALQAMPAVPAHRQDTDTPLPAKSPASAPAWERKPVVVLAIDLVFPTTAASEALPFEPWTAAHRWEHAIVEKVRGFGGILLQRLSSLYAVAFGVPRALEQLPERGVQAALAIRQLVIEAQSVAAKEPVPEVRQAVHLGTMLVETQAGALTERYQAEGETLSLAVRLLGHAGPGELLVSPQVGRLIARWCELQAHDVSFGARHMPPMAAYRVAGLLPWRSLRAELGARGLSPFVGRERELARLGELLAQVGQGHGQVVGVVGEPGIGKSRLIYEFTRAPHVYDWQVLDGRAVAYGAAPYRLVIDLLKTYFQIGGRDEARVIRQKVTDRLSSRKEIDRPVLPAVLDLLGAPAEHPEGEALDPTQRRRRILAAVKRLLLGESHIQPVLLVVEDLQWVDGETQAVLDSLVESLPAARLLVLASFRPEYLHGWGGKTYYTQLRLDPLPPEPAQALLQAMLGDAAEWQPITRLLLEQTEGNPFFLEESVQTLIETQVIAGERGAYRLVKSPQRLQVPTTVQALLAARMDRLSPEGKQLLQTAAVIGTVVPLPLLRALVDVDEEAIGPALDHLQAAEFLYQTHLVPEVTYTFKHALTHEVAYGSLLQEQRRRLHGRIVGAIERRASDHVAELVELLAHHALRGELWAKALAYCRQAGEKALARSAHREAVGFFEQALSALTHLPETRATREQAIDLRLALRSALYPSGDTGRILACLREAEALAEALDDPRRLGKVSIFLSLHFHDMSAHDQATAAAQRALALATASGDAILHALANQQLGTTYQVQGNYRQAIDSFGQAVAFLEGADCHERFGEVFLPAVFSRASLAACHAELGTFSEGRALGDEGLRIAEAVAHPASLMLASWGMGWLALRQGELAAALPRLEEAVALCQEVDLPGLFPWMAEALGTAYALGGRVADAVSLLTHVLEQSTATEMAGDQALYGLALGEALMLDWRLEEAHALAERTLALTREHQMRGDQAYALHLLGEITTRREPPERRQAEDAYRQALALAEALGLRPLQAHCHRGLGKLYTTLGLRAEACAELAAAVALYRAMDMTFWLPGVDSSLAAVEGVITCGDR